MKNFWIIFILVSSAAFFLYKKGSVSYNEMVEKRQNVEAQWAQVQNVIQRRNDLIPKIEQVAKVNNLSNFTELYTLLEKSKASGEEIGDAEKMQNFNTNQDALSKAIKDFLHHPELQRTPNFPYLMQEIEGSENRISVERKKYNEVAKVYNTFLLQFPNNLFAKAFGQEKVGYFEGANAEPLPQQHTYENNWHHGRDRMWQKHPLPPTCRKRLRHI